MYTPKLSTILTKRVSYILITFIIFNRVGLVRLKKIETIPNPFKSGLYFFKLNIFQFKNIQFGSNKTKSVWIGSSVLTTGVHPGLLLLEILPSAPELYTTIEIFVSFSNPYSSSSLSQQHHWCSLFISQKFTFVCAEFDWTCLR